VKEAIGWQLGTIRRASKNLKPRGRFRKSGKPDKEKPSGKNPDREKPENPIGN
jgi:hypothetical protein